MKALFVSDIDGTLLKTNAPLPPAVPEAIHRFQEAGGLFCLCTGRAMPAAAPIAEKLHLSSPCILCGGGLIYDFASSQPLYAQPLDGAIRDQLSVLMDRQPQISVTVATAKTICRIRDNERLLRHGVYEDRTAPMGKLEDIRDPIKILLTCDEPALLEAAVADYVDLSRAELHRASTHFYELTAKGVNKGTAVRTLGQLLGRCRIFSAGDALSDLTMAKESELFFAPETAMEAVRSRADRIFPAPSQGGIAQALDEVTRLISCE